jgi:hypothetical protein
LFTIAPLFVLLLLLLQGKPALHTVLCFASSGRTLLHFWRRTGIQKRGLLFAASQLRRPQIRGFPRFSRSRRLLRLRGAHCGFSLGVNVEATLQGVIEPVNPAQRYPPTSGHRP